MPEDDDTADSALTIVKKLFTIGIAYGLLNELHSLKSVIKISKGVFHFVLYRKGRIKAAVLLQIADLYPRVDAKAAFAVISEVKIKLSRNNVQKR